MYKDNFKNFDILSAGGNNLPNAGGVGGGGANFPDAGHGGVAISPSIQISGNIDAGASFPGGSHGGGGNYPAYSQGGAADYPAGSYGGAADYPEASHGEAADYPAYSHGEAGNYPSYSLGEGADPSYSHDYFGGGHDAAYQNGYEGAAGEENSIAGLGGEELSLKEGTKSKEDSKKMIEMLILKLKEMDKFWDSWVSDWNNDSLGEAQVGVGVTTRETEEEGITEEDAEDPNFTNEAEMKVPDETEGAENEKEKPDKAEEEDKMKEPDDNAEDLVKKPIEGDVDVPTEELVAPVEEEEGEVPDDLSVEEPLALKARKRLRRKRRM